MLIGETLNSANIKCLGDCSVRDHIVAVERKMTIFGSHKSDEIFSSPEKGDSKIFGLNS
jgi:hypothetical protein